MPLASLKTAPVAPPYLAFRLVGGGCGRHVWGGGGYGRHVWGILGHEGDALRSSIMP